MGVFAQEKFDLKSQIIAKEKTLSEATTVSRQGYQDLQNELQTLYANYRDEIELELKTITDSTIRAAKEKELAAVNEKITK